MSEKLDNTLFNCVATLARSPQHLSPDEGLLQKSEFRCIVVIVR